MSTVNINIRIDSELKKNAESLFYDLGLNISSAITLFLTAAVNNEGIPFEIKRTPRSEIIAITAEYEEMKRNPETYKSYYSFNEIAFEVMKL